MKSRRFKFSHGALLATTLSAAFTEFRSNLEITSSQTSSVSTTQQAVRTHIERDLTVLDSFLTGSYRRHTLIAPLKEADIDVFVVLDSRYYQPSGYANLLDRVRRVLLKKYTKTPRISRNGQAVTITFTQFRMDVVPGFYRKGGGYLIPDSRGRRWISTDPKKHVEIAAGDNTAHNSNLVPLLKMLKAWNRVHSERLRSFHLERLFTNTLSGHFIQYWDATLEHAFAQARLGVLLKAPDPAGYGGDLSDYLTHSDRLSASRALHLASRQANAARVAHSLGQEAQAIGEWRKIFRGYFPAYG